MDLFSNPRYRVNIILLQVLGQWPLQSKIERILLTLLWSSIITSLLVPQIHRCVVEPTEEILMSNIPPLITVSLGIAKILNSIFNGNKIRQLLMLMDDEWARLKPGPSFDIMQKYANNGYKYTVFYCFLMYNSMVVFLLLPMRPKILFWLGLSDTDAEFLLPFPTDYWVNDDKYFVFIVMHVYFGTTFVITAIAGPDVLYLVFVQHVCGMFAEVSYRLENVPIKPLADVNLYVDKKDDEAFLIISDCIRQHNKAIDFSVRLEKTYSWLFLYIVCVNTLVLTFSGVQMMAHLDDVDELFRYIPFAGSQLMHIFVESIVAQQLMDHSSHVDYAIVMMRWYAMSLRSQKLLNLMTIRSRVLNKITAGKIFILSLEFFGTVVKTSMTYFTLLRSMQEENAS